MSYIVRCKYKASVQLPEGVCGQASKEYACPGACSRKNNLCSLVQSFSAVFAQETGSEKPAGVVIKYSDEEKRKNWGISAGEDKPKQNSGLFSDIQKADVFVAPVSLPDTIAAAKSTEPLNKESPAEGLSVRKTTEKYNFKGVGAQNKAKESAESEILSIDKNLFQKFVIGGKVFSDNAAFRSSNNAQPLKNALRDIFTFWETKSVFKSGAELKDEFIWLLVCSSQRKILKSEVDGILLNESYDTSKKFFYLFYDVVFRYEPPRGFYWCDKKMSLDPLPAKFKDKEDFMVRYCKTANEGEQFRLFFWAHKEEVLHFLGCEGEESLFEDMTQALAKERGLIVHIDKHNNYFPTHLGTITQFIADMQKPSELSRMKDMVRFLQTYTVTAHGVFVRGESDKFVKSERNGLTEDESMYSSLNLSSSSAYASEYDCFVTLLREYVRVFKPAEVKIGSLRFTKNNYSLEIEENVRALCAALFGQVSDDVLYAAKSAAWLTKSIFEREILSNFICENKPRIVNLTELIADAGLNQNLEKYFALFPDPVFSFKKSELTAREYISQKMNGDVFTVCGHFKEDKIINAFFKAKIKTVPKVSLSELYSKYEEQYKDFILT